jgi:hypothetical protein
MQNTERHTILSEEAGAQNPGSIRVVHTNLSLLLIILLIGILIISLIILIG